MKKMPKWIPGEMEGKSVASEYMITVSFRLPDVAATEEEKAENEFDEVVVVGYGAVKKSTETREMRNRESNPVHKNELVLKSGGKDDPAIFIDGALFEGDLEALDPKTIESISVRKDTPEYSNGVVDIKLKKSTEVMIHLQGDNTNLVVGASSDEN